MNPKPTLKQRLNYWYDNFMARGGVGMFISLFVVFAAALVVIGLLMAVVHPDPKAEFPSSFFSNFWWTFLHLTDPGTMLESTDRNILMKLFSVAAGILGLIIFSVLIAFLTTSFETKMEELKKGKSQVLESGHTLILGFNDRLVDIISELIIANESERDACVVVLADKDKEEMDDFLRDKLPDLQTTRVVTRSGETSAIADLEKVKVDEAKSVIILPKCSANSPAETKAFSDSRVLKSILGICNRPNRREESFHIVTEIFEEANIDIIKTIAPEEVTVVHADQIIGKILVQTSRCNGLAFVYDHMMGFEGSEMYFVEAPAPTPFGEVNFHFADGACLGVRREGKITINPPADHELIAGDEVIVLAEDDSTAVWGDKVMEPKALELRPSAKPPEPRQERHLIIGYNAKAETIIREFDDYVAPGTKIKVVLRHPREDIVALLGRLNDELENVSVEWETRNCLLRDDLVGVEPFTYDTVLIMAEEGENINIEDSDSQTILILLLLRDIQTKMGESKEVEVITEILDHRNLELIATAKVNDFVISNHVISKLIAQISEVHSLDKVYDDLFQAEGSEIYLKPISYYLSDFPVDLRFGDLMALAGKRGEAAIGYRRGAEASNAASEYGLVLNPDKTGTITFQADDQLIVVAEDEY